MILTFGLPEMSCTAWANKRANRAGRHALDAFFPFTNHIFMRSSLTAAFRALSLLACLMALPIMALWGSSLPVKLSSLIEGHWPRFAENRQPGRLGEGERFEPIKSPSNETVAARPGGTKLDPQRESFLRGPNQEISGQKNSVRSVIPVMYQEPVSAVSFNGAPTEQSLAANEHFNRMHDRLRQLGAIRTLLQSWGNQTGFYRFDCSIKTDGNASVTRQFQATASDPLQAVAEVLRQVETWRSGRP
jgi:hypothetical protein